MSNKNRFVYLFKDNLIILYSYLSTAGSHFSFTKYSFNLDDWHHRNSLRSSRIKFARLIIIRSHVEINNYPEIFFFLNKNISQVLKLNKLNVATYLTSTLWYGIIIHRGREKNRRRRKKSELE